MERNVSDKNTRDSSIIAVTCKLHAAGHAAHVKAELSPDLLHSYRTVFCERL